MVVITEAIKTYEKEIEQILTALEQANKLSEALSAYRAVEAKIETLALTPNHPAFKEQQRVLAYCLMRQANLLRQMGEMQEAEVVSERELAAARASAHDITLARSLMSRGATALARGEINSGLGLVEKARALFAAGESYDHKQGLGWYWILQADLGNAGIIQGGLSKVFDAVNQAITILLPLKNWTGVARAYAARAKAHETLGDATAATADREVQSQYERLVAISKEKPKPNNHCVNSV